MHSLENWDKTVRTQYEYKAKDKPHPYGTDEEPNRFRNFHVFTKLRVLYRLAQWTFHNPDHIRKHFASETDWDDQYMDWVRIVSMLHELPSILTSSSKRIQLAGTVKIAYTTNLVETDSTDVPILLYQSPPNRSRKPNPPRKRESQGLQSAENWMSQKTPILRWQTPTTP